MYKRQVLVDLAKKPYVEFVEYGMRPVEGMSYIVVEYVNNKLEYKFVTLISDDEGINTSVGEKDFIGWMRIENMKGELLEERYYNKDGNIYTSNLGNGMMTIEICRDFKSQVYVPGDGGGDGPVHTNRICTNFTLFNGSNYPTNAPQIIKSPLEQPQDPQPEGGSEADTSEIPQPSPLRHNITNYNNYVH